jgi:hypothetical protein
MSNKLDINDVAEFTWMWCDKFFLETNKGNFIWSDPDYGGDNTIVKTDFDLAQYCENMHVGCGRSKGKHIIDRYCGDQVKIIDEEAI